MTAEEMARIHAAAFAGSRGWSVAEFTRLLHSHRVLCVCKGPCFALGQLAGEEADLLTLACAPQQQGMGFGRLTLAEFEARANAAGVVRVILEVAADNRVARALYDRAGYRVQGQRPGYYKRACSPPIDALILGKGL